MRKYPSARRAAGLCSLLAALAAPAVASLPEIEYASPDPSVWTTRVDARGAPDNPLLRIAGPLFAQAGIPWRASSYPASRLFVNLQDGSAQFSMLVRVPALAACCIYSRKPVVRAEIRVYRRAGTPPLERREDFASKSVILIHGYSYGGLAKYLEAPVLQARREVAQTHAAAFRMLAGGRADYLVDYVGPATEVLADEGIAGIESSLLSRQEVFLVLSRNYPDAANVMHRLERIVDDMDVDVLLRTR